MIEILVSGLCIGMAAIIGLLWSIFSAVVRVGDMLAAICSHLDEHKEAGENNAE